MSNLDYPSPDATGDQVKHTNHDSPQLPVYRSEHHKASENSRDPAANALIRALNASKHLKSSRRPSLARCPRLLLQISLTHSAPAPALISHDQLESAYHDSPKLLVYCSERHGADKSSQNPHNLDTGRSAANALIRALNASKDLNSSRRPSLSRRPRPHLQISSTHTTPATSIISFPTGVDSYSSNSVRNKACNHSDDGTEDQVESAYHTSPKSPVYFPCREVDQIYQGGPPDSPIITEGPKMNQSVANAITPTPKRLKFSRWYSSSRRARTLSRASSTRSTPASAAASLPGSGGSSSPVSDKDCHQSADVSRAQAPEPIREPPQGEPRSPTPDSADKYQGESHSMPNHAASPNEETKRRGREILQGTTGSTKRKRDKKMFRIKK